MAHGIRAFEETPNPNALKCLLDAEAPPCPGRTIRSYASAAEADDAGDRFAVALFGVSGVARVMVLGSFVTVSRSPEAKWPAMKTGLKRAVEGHG